LIKTERADIRKYLDFWAIDPICEADKYLGYIKLIHSRVFLKKSTAELKFTVKSVDQKGSLKMVFVVISF
jgi:hypothetical protein